MWMIVRANLRAHRREALLTLICAALAFMGLTFMMTMLGSIDATLRLNEAQSYGAQHAVFMNATPKQIEALQKSGVVSTESGYVYDIFGVNVISYGVADKLQMGYFDDAAWRLGRLKVLEGRRPEVKGEIALERSIKACYYPDLAVGDSVKLSAEYSDGTQKTGTYILVGIIEDYSTYWQEIYNEFPPSPRVFPNIICARSEFNEFHACHWLLALNTEIVPARLLNDSNELLKSVSATWSPNVKVYQEELGAVKRESFDNMARYMAMLLTFCACVALITIERQMLESRNQQRDILRTLGIPRRAALVSFTMESGTLLLLAMLLGVGLGLALCYLTRPIVKAMYDARFEINIPAKRLLRTSVGIFVTLLLIACVSLVNAPKRAHTRSMIGRVIRPYHIPRRCATLFLAGKIYHAHRRAYIIGTLNIAMSIALLCAISVMLPRSIEQQFADEPDFTFGVLTGSYTLPYGVNAQIPIHLKQISGISEELASDIIDLPQTRRSTTHKELYDCLVMLPRQYCEQQGWFNYDMHINYSADIYTYKRKFQTAMRAELDDCRAFSPEYPWAYATAQEFKQLSLDYENYAFVACNLIETDEAISQDGKIHCRAELSLAKYASTSIDAQANRRVFDLQPGDWLDCAYFTIDSALKSDVTLTDVSGIERAGARFVVDEVTYQSETPFPLTLYLPNGTFALMGLDRGYDSMNIYLNPDSGRETVRRLLDEFKRERGGVGYYVDREAIILAQRRNAVLLNFIADCTLAAAFILGVMTLMITQMARNAMRADEWRLYCTLGMSLYVIRGLKLYEGGTALAIGIVVGGLAGWIIGVL